MAEQASSEQAVAPETGGGAVKGIMKWLAIGVGFFAIATVSPLVSQKLFGVPGAGHTAGGEAAEEEAPKGPPQYFAIEPSLVVSLPDGHMIRFVQADVQVMARDAEAIAAVQTHNPVIRNNLLMLISGKDMASLKSVEGKEALRREALAEVQAILTEHTGSPGVEDLYFTGFVIQ